MSKRCKECRPGTKRPAPFPGPRCHTHHAAVLKARSSAAHENRVQKLYSLPAGGYEALLVAQGRKCAICRRSTGRTKRLAVDHDHACCPRGQSCGRCVRGALCGPCNRLLGYVRDDPEMLERAAAYLRDPPARRLLT